MSNDIFTLGKKYNVRVTSRVNGVKFIVDGLDVCTSNEKKLNIQITALFDVSDFRFTSQDTSDDMFDFSGKTSFRLTFPTTDLTSKQYGFFFDFDDIMSDFSYGLDILDFKIDHCNKNAKPISTAEMWHLIYNDLKSVFDCDIDINEIDFILRNESSGKGV